MNGSYRTTAGFILLLALIGAGFISGNAIGARLRRHSDNTLIPWMPGSNSAEEDRSAPTATPSEVFASVLEKIQQDYVGSTGSVPITDLRLTEGAVSHMVASLQDPRTNYLDPKQTKLRINSLLGRLSGIGADFAIISRHSNGDDLNYSFLTVRSVAPGGPAERAGLHSGDHITSIDDQWIIAYPVLSDSSNKPGGLPDRKRDDPKQPVDQYIKPGISAAHAIQILTSGTGKTLHLTIARAGQTAPQQIAVTTCQTIVPSAQNTLMGRGILYLRVASFNSDEAAVVEAALNRRQDWSVGLIIDLRQNAGGVEAEGGSRLDGYRYALELIRHITKKRAVAQIERAPGVRKPITGGGPIPTINSRARVAVLIDAGTSNIAEMAAAALRDAGGAKLIGSHTFGDGVLPYLCVLKEGGAIEMASAHLFTAGGGDLSDGLDPDIPVGFVAQPVGGPEDPGMQRAMSFVSG